MSGRQMSEKMGRLMSGKQGGRCPKIWGGRCPNGKCYTTSKGAIRCGGSFGTDLSLSSPWPLSQMSGIRILISRCLNFDDFIFWQSDTKLCWGNEKMVGEMQQFVGEMQHFVGETKQFVGEMKQICWGNEANGWGNEAKSVGEMPRR